MIFYLAGDTQRMSRQVHFQHLLLLIFMVVDTTMVITLS